MPYKDGVTNDKEENMRVTLKVCSWELVFDFENPTEGYNFAKIAKDHFNKNAGDGVVDIKMSFIPDKEDETED